MPLFSKLTNIDDIPTFGKVTAEALVYSTLVVAYDATATPELIGAGCGHVIQMGYITGAKNAITDIIQAPDLRENCR